MKFVIDELPFCRTDCPFYGEDRNGPNNSRRYTCRVGYLCDFEDLEEGSTECNGLITIEVLKEKQ